MRKCGKFLLLAILAIVLIATLVACNQNEAGQNGGSTTTPGGNTGGGDTTVVEPVPSGLFFKVLKGASTFDKVAVSDFDVTRDIEAYILLRAGNAAPVISDKITMTEDMIVAEDRAKLDSAYDGPINVEYDHEGKTLKGTFIIHLKNDSLPLVPVKIVLKDGASLSGGGATSGADNVWTVSADPGVSYTFEEFVSAYKVIAPKGEALSHYTYGEEQTVFGAGDTLTVTEGMTLTAVFSSSLVEVNFVLQAPADCWEEGTQVSDPAPVYVAANGVVPRPEAQAYSSDKYTLLGWSLDPDGNELWNFSKRLSAQTGERNSLTLYAKWVVKSATVTLSLPIGSFVDSATGIELSPTDDLKPAVFAGTYDEEGNIDSFVVGGIAYGDMLKDYYVEFSLNELDNPVKVALEDLGKLLTRSSVYSCEGIYLDKTYQTSAFDVPVSGVDLYAVYEKDDGTPVGPGPEPAAEPTVTIDMPDEFVIGVETEFSVSTTKGDTTGTVYVKGTGSFEGIPGVDYNIWYLEDQGGKWYAWDGATFGPSTGFPLSDATSKFKVQFINAGAYDLTVQIVTVDNGDVVCETAAVVNVPAENTLGYHIQNAVDFVYTDDPDDYNADAYTYKGILSSSAGAIVASYGYDYYEALIEDLQKNPASMSEKTRDIMNDFARYMGALYRSADGDVGRVSFNGTEYMWKADSDGAWLNGSNWRDADGKTLTEIVVQYIAQSQNTKVVMEVSSNGISAETLTYSVQFDDAPVIPEKVVPGITFDMPEFTAGQEGTFQVSFIANDYVGEMAVVKAIFGGDAGDITSVYYWNVNSKAWTIMTAEADGSYMYGGSGFPLMDATSTFKATIANAGVYTLNVEILVGGESIASKTATFVVGEPVQEPEVEKFTVSFIVNGESYGSAVSVEKGESILLPTPSVDGYVFNGWYAQGGSEADAVTGYYAPAADVMLVASLTAVAEPEEPVYYNVQVGSNTYSKLADSPVGLPAIYDGKAVTGWSTTSGTYTSVYYVNPADADENKTITLTPMYAGETYTINATLEGESSHASLSTPSRINDNFYITVFTDAGYQIESFSAKVGDTVLGINPVSTIDRHTVTFIVEVSVYGQVDVTFTIAENDVSENISVIVEAALDENRNEGAYITVEADSDGYLPRDGTVVVTYHYAYVSDSGRLTMGSSSTVQISLDNNGELTSQRVFVNLDDSSNYADDGQEQFVNGHAYAIVAVYSYGTESVISNTETPAYVNES